MAATVSSPWSKPGAWALDAEEHDAELQQQQDSSLPAAKPQDTADFPSLAAAAADAKTAKKKKKSKGTTISLYSLQAGTYTKPEFNTAALPKGPRERSAEELDQMRNGGGGFRSYGDSSSSRWGKEAGGGRDSNFRDSSRERDVMREPLGPSRADEADDWSKGKRSPASGGAGGGDGFDRRGGRERGSSFFEGHSKADDAGSWVSNKPPQVASVEPRRFGGGSGGGGFEKRGSFDSLSRDRYASNGGGSADSETWGRKREESNGVSNAGSARPRLVLQPRTAAPISPIVSPVVANGSESVAAKPKGSNPFGNARPREEVLAEKGKDWKEIDEKLDSMKIKSGEDDKAAGDKSSRWSFGRVGVAEEGVEKSWRKAVTDAPADDSSSRPQSAESAENGHAESAENGHTESADSTSDEPANSGVVAAEEN
ncbi:Eukaryotic translation initiation factor 4B3 [Linum perenne]